MKKYYYITPENEQRGPVEDYMLASCGVNSNTMVWTEGMANWMPAGQIPELVFFINTTSSSSTPPPFDSTAQQQSTNQGGGFNTSDGYNQQANNQGGFNQGGYNQGGYNQQAYNPGGYNQFSGNQAGGTGWNPMGGHPGPRPDNNLVWAILATVFCCLPLGIYSIILASRVNGLYDRGDYIGAQQAADDAKNWAIYSLIAYFAIWVIYVIFAFLVGGISLSQYL